MPEIVQHRHAPGDPAHFHPPLDAFEGVEGGLDLLVLQPAMFRARDHRQRIAHVQFAHKVRVELETRNLELGRSRSIADVESLHCVAFAKTKPLYRAMGHLQQRRQVPIIAIAQQQPVSRNQSDEMFE